MTEKSLGHRPNFIKIKKSPISGKGAFASRKIKKGTFLGNYMGCLTPSTTMTGPYVFHTTRNSTRYSINWTRWMNCSTSTHPENVTSYYLTNTEPCIINGKSQSIEGYIVFYSNRDINPGDELLYYYGDYYASLLD